MLLSIIVNKIKKRIFDLWSNYVSPPPPPKLSKHEGFVFYIYLVRVVYLLYLLNTSGVFCTYSTPPGFSVLTQHHWGFLYLLNTTGVFRTYSTPLGFSVLTQHHWGFLYLLNTTGVFYF